MSASRLPDSHVLWSPETGEVTVGEIRLTAPEQGPVLSLEEATIRLWEDIVTRNLCLHPWEQPVSPSEIRAFHASLYTDDQILRPST